MRALAAHQNKSRVEADLSALDDVESDPLRLALRQDLLPPLEPGCNHRVSQLEAGIVPGSRVTRASFTGSYNIKLQWSKRLSLMPGRCLTTPADHTGAAGRNAKCAQLGLAGRTHESPESSCTLFKSSPKRARRLKALSLST